MREFTFFFYTPGNFYRIVPWFISLYVYMIKIALKCLMKSVCIDTWIASVGFNPQFKD